MNSLHDRIQSFAYRIRLTYSKNRVNLGSYNPRHPQRSFFHFPVVVIVDHLEDLDNVKIVLKHMNLLNDSYVIPYQLVDGLSNKINTKLLKELLEIINPITVIIAGEDAASLLKDRIRSGKISFARHHGKTYHSTKLDREIVIMYPTDTYVGKAKAANRKKAAKRDWQKLKDVLDNKKKECIIDTWLVNEREASKIIDQSQEQMR